MNIPRKEMEPDQGHPVNPPMLFAWIATIVTVSLIVATQFLPRVGNQYLRGSGVVTLLLGGVFSLVPFYLLPKHGGGKGEKTYMQAGKVVDQSLYAITRHPQYLGYIFLSLGFTLLSQHWATFLLAIIAASLFYIQAVQEEMFCLTRFGEPYARYRRRVPRFNILLGILRILQGRY
jgi:protein-S-isoprenylcysteine O-methyltransferase Ste14